MAIPTPSLEACGLLNSLDYDCCALAMRCGMPKIRTNRRCFIPKKDYNRHEDYQFNPLDCGGGPIKTAHSERLPFTTNNVQESVLYNNPNQTCALADLATCCGS